MHIFRNGDIEYCVDDMIDFVSTCSLPVAEYKVCDLNKCLKNRVWSSPYLGNYSPWDVITNPYSYWYEYCRILTADTRYPIIVNNGTIVDGFHRLAKCYLNGEATIDAYEFTDEIMDLFVI